MNITIVDGYLGGSHKQWADALKTHSKHNINVIGLSAKYWKWRMQGAAMTLAQSLEIELPEVDLFVCSDMLNLPLFKSLLPKKYSETPIILYMHENQISYPWSPNDPEKKKDRDFSYSFINLASALTADRVCYNSAYHKSSFLKGATELLKMMPDNKSLDSIDKIAAKSSVLYVGIDYRAIQKAKTESNNTRPIILWNHRWEYDKNPELFFKTLIQLKNEGHDFSLVVLGQDYPRKPEIFNEAKEALKDKILHFGYLDNINDYYQWLWKADILPVTCNQDFFGISVVEAIAANCLPVLPNRLSYPEHLNPEDYPKCFYENDNLYDKLKEILNNKSYLDCALGEHMQKYDWNLLVNTYDDFFETVVE